MKTVLYFNYGVTKACGVYDLGLRHWKAIRNIKGYDIRYMDINGPQEYFNACDIVKPDLIIFNYLEGLSLWMNKSIHSVKCPKICIPHDMRQGNIHSFRRDDLFDYYIILDENSKEDDKVFKTDRPLTKCKIFNLHRNNIPKIGSFGFALTHKNFHLIAREVNKSFDEAIINFHMPHAYYDRENQTAQVIEMCKAEITKENITLNISTEFLTEIEVVELLSNNDINCLFYDAPRDLGISSSLDFVVSAQKPILITESPMFRSYSNKLSKFPNATMNQVYDNWEDEHKKILELYAHSIGCIESETKEIFDRILQ